MNKQQLASNIWALANELRGKVPAATYKDYMLGFLFYKYLSDREENYLISKLYFTNDDLYEVSEEDEKLKKNCMDNIGYFISYDNLFSTWVALEEDFSIENVTVALSAFERLVSPAYKKVFSNIFSTLTTRITDLGSTDPERTKNAKSIIKLVKSIPTAREENYDVLGFIYEYLLKNFAANAGKAGEFYTPHEASVIMAEIIAYNLKDRENISIYDPTSGSGSLLINIGQAIASYLGDKNKIKYYAQELIQETYNLTRMNLVMRDILPSNIVVRQGDTLDNDWPYFEDNKYEETYEYLPVDACCSNPPYSQPWDPREDSRFDGYGLAPKSKADYAFLLHNLYHLKPDGIMTIVLPHGVLFRGGEEETIRKELVKKHKIETIIGLPANLFYGTGIPTIIMVLRKTREEDDILFIDASKGFVKEGNKNKLRERDIRKIVDTVISRKTIPHYSRIVKYTEIEKNDFNLNIPRYVDSSINEKVHDIYALMYGGIPGYEINDESFKDYWIQFPSLKNELFVPIKEDYYDIVQKDINDIINNNIDVRSFITDHNDRFSYLKEYLIDNLINNIDDISIDFFEKDVMNTIRAKVDEDSLIDYYDCFELFDDKWQEIILDIEIVKKQGFIAAREIDEIKVLKKDSKSKKLEEKIIGNDGRLIPFEMIQKMYYEDKFLEIERLNCVLSDLLNKKDELLDSIEPEDKSELLKDDDSGDIVAKKLNNKISEIKKKLKKGAEFEEGSYESIMLEIASVNSEISKAKALIKSTQNELIELTEEKIKALSDAEIRDLLTQKWILPICDGINNLSNRLIILLEKEIKELYSKYGFTFSSIEEQINKSEDALSSLLGDLCGEKSDIEGIGKFRTILGGVQDE